MSGNSEIMHCWMLINMPYWADSRLSGREDVLYFQQLTPHTKHPSSSCLNLEGIIQIYRCKLVIIFRPVQAYFCINNVVHEYIRYILLRCFYKSYIIAIYKHRIIVLLHSLLLLSQHASQDKFFYPEWLWKYWHTKDAKMSSFIHWDKYII